MQPASQEQRARVLAGESLRNMVEEVMKLCVEKSHPLAYIGNFKGNYKNSPSNLSNVPGITRTFLKPHINSNNQVINFF